MFLQTLLEVEWSHGGQILVLAITSQCKVWLQEEAENICLQSQMQWKMVQDLQMLSRVTLNWRVTLDARTVILNSQKCNEFLQAVTSCKSHKSPGLLFENVLKMSVSLTFGQPGHVSSSLWSNVSRVTLWMCSLNVFVIVDWGVGAGDATVSRSEIYWQILYEISHSGLNNFSFLQQTFVLLLMYILNQ